MKAKTEIQHIYLVGAKSLGAYGGYETFVYKLTEHHQNKENIKYHVACKANGDGCMDETKFDGVTKINDHEFELHNAHCFKIILHESGAFVTQTALGFDGEATRKMSAFLQGPKPELLHHQKFFENGTAERAKESGTEQNYNMIDGCVNNVPKKPRRIGGRWSVLDRLHIKQAERRQKDNAPQQEQERSRKS